MKAIVLRAVAGLLAMFIAAGVVIRAQPYDDGDLRAVLLPNECAVPCFMGVQPGVTPLTDALRLLEQHEWVATVSRPTDSERLEIIRTGTVTTIVTWNGSQPAFFDSPTTAITFGLRGMHVQSLSVPLNLSLADFWLFVGAPKRGSNTPFSVSETASGRAGDQMIVEGLLRDDQPNFAISFGPSLCPARMGYMVARHAVLLMTAPEQAGDTTSPPFLRYLIGCNAGS